VSDILEAMQLRALAFGIALSTLMVAACGDNIHEGNEPQTPARIVTRVTPDPVTAGATLTATCIVYDADDHVIEDATPTFAISPADPNTTITDLTAVVTKAGHYAGQCVLADLFGNDAGFEVVHALPSTLVIDKQPDQQVYAIGATVTITHAVADRYGNPITDALVVDTSTLGNGASGPITNVNANAFAYGSEGSYHVHSQVMPPTDGGADVSANLDLIINENGPAVTCGSPLDGSMLNLAPGGSLAIAGTAIDPNGTMTVTVNGTPAAVDVNGAFSASLTTRFGINFVDVIATDTFGVTTAKVCTFLVANQWAPETASYSDTVALRLGQSAIDDNNRNNGINSLADLLYTVANSAGLHTTLHDALLAANPLKPEACDKRDPLFGLCLYSSGIEYQSSALPGPNTDNLTLVTGGLAMSETVNNPSLNLRVHGDVGPLGYDTSGAVDISFITISATFDLGLSAGKPHMAIRSGTVTTTVGSISTNFNGVDGWIVNNIVVPLAQGTLRNAVATQVTNYISNNFNAVLDGVVSGLDISTLGASFAVPRFDSGTLTLSFAPSFTSLGVTSGRALFGIGTKLTAPVGQNRPSLGIAIPTGAVLTDPNPGGQSTAIAAHIGILDQALHALWRGNFFHAVVDPAQYTGGTPGQATLTVDTRLPPVASFVNGIVGLDLGDVDLVLDTGTSTIAMTAGIRAHTNVALVGSSLSFSGIVLDEVHLSSDMIDLTQMQQDQMQMLVQGLAQDLIDTSLNSALPSLPIPSFTLPASLAQYGLPAGAQLGITSPSLVVTPPHFVLRGGFGVQ
jgi:hypothetical protein